MKMIQKWELPYSIDLILGLPGDNLEGWKHSVRQVMNYKPQRYQSFLCSILPGTEYDLNRKKYGIKTIQGGLMDDDEKVIQTSTFPIEDLALALNIESWLYFAFSINLCSKTIKVIAERTQRDIFDLVNVLMNWAKDYGPTMSSAISGYRDNLYDSRQRGRVEIETCIFENFVDIHDELHAFIDVEINEEEIHDILDIELLTFPKNADVIERLTDIGKIYPGKNGTFIHERRDQSFWEYSPPQSDPILGVIGTKYSFWTWTSQRIS
jgi:hypothetical protein